MKILITEIMWIYKKKKSDFLSKTGLLNFFELFWEKWVVMDSNHRRHSQQIYSLPHLATLVTTHSLSFSEPLVGFEPTTPRLQITCSGQLS